MRIRLRHLLAAAVALGCVYVAAPALSSQRYMPGAVDFQQALPAMQPAGDLSKARLERSRAKAGSGPVTYRSPIIVAPERFDLAGLAGEMRPLEFRGRDSGGEWSDWAEAEDGNPVYFGGADELQLRARGWRPRGHLHYVNVSGTTSTAGGLLSTAREAINTAFISSTGWLQSSADASPTRPTLISRAAWGANLAEGGCKPRVAPEQGTVKAAVIHHTVTANNYTEAEAPSIVLGICRYHRNANGWNDIGYNALVDRFGNIYAGRAGGIKKAIVGAQAQGFNSQTTGIASIGTHTDVVPSDAATGAIVDFLAWKLAISGLNAVGKTTIVSAGGELSRYPAGRRVRLNRIFGHGTVGLTACPGAALEAEIPEIRRRIQARIDASGGPVTVPPTDPGGGITPK